MLPSAIGIIFAGLFAVICVAGPADAGDSRITQVGNGTKSEEPPGREPVPHGARDPLGDAALRRALYGNYVERDMTGVYDRGGLEFFCSNGGWHELGGRAPFGGPFTISNGAVCVEYPPGSTCCRRFHIDATGQYLYELEPSSRDARCGRYIPPEADPSSLVPVIIFPRRTGPDSCR